MGCIKKFVTYDLDEKGDNTICADSFHPYLKKTSHGKRSTLDDIGLFMGDTSTEIAIDQIEKEWSQLNISTQVTCNHFDVDGCLSVWCLMNPEEALKYKPILIEASRIDDLREITLTKDNKVKYDTALRLCCWIVEMEQKHFWKQYEKANSEYMECPKKYEYFLPKILGVLRDVTGEYDNYKNLYNTVITDLNYMYESGKTKVERWDDLGITVVWVDKPLHYYALFTPCKNADTVITVYPNNKYEIEDKYTSFIQMTSRDSYPRLDLTPLVMVLNTKEPRFRWIPDHIQKLGKMTRLHDPNVLHKDLVSEYEGPRSRKILNSHIQESDFLHTVRSFYTFAKSKPRRYWTWEDVFEVNNNIPWDNWLKKW